MLDRFLQRWREMRKRRKHQRAMALFRREMGFFGAPLEHLTDAEVLEGVEALGKALRASGIDSEQLDRNLASAAVVIVGDQECP